MNITEIDTNETEGESLPFTVVYAEIPLEGIKGRIIRNPNYGGPTLSIYGWTWRPEVSLCRKPQFMEALRDSISKEGVRNPIVVYATLEGDFVSFGGSRVIASRAAGLDTIPAIINDYSGRYEEELRVTPENARKLFTDIPEYIEFGPTGFDTHYSLERNRRDHYDPAGMKWAGNAEWIKTEFKWINNA